MRLFYGCMAYLFLLLIGAPVFATDACRDLTLTGCPDHKHTDYRLNVSQYESCKASWGALFDSHAFHDLKKSTIASFQEGTLDRYDLLPKNGGITHRILITAGVHGDEAIGPIVVARLLEKIKLEPAYAQIAFSLVPNLSPYGLKQCTRGGREGQNLNRVFKPQSEHELKEALLASLKNQEFDLGLDLHEAFKKNGFFVIANDAQGIKFAQKALTRMPLEVLWQSKDGLYPAHYQRNGRVIYAFSSPGVSKSRNKGTVKSFMQDLLGIPYAFTLESVGSFQLEERALIYLDLIDSLIETLKG